MSQDFPPGFFARLDESEDAGFYAAPRFVVHIDDATIAALTRWCWSSVSTRGTALHVLSAGGGFGLHTVRSKSSIATIAECAV